MAFQFVHLQIASAFVSRQFFNIVHELRYEGSLCPFVAQTLTWPSIIEFTLRIPYSCKSQTDGIDCGEAQRFMYLAKV